MLAMRFAIALREQYVDRLSKHFVGRVAEHTCRLGVDELDQAVFG